MSPEPQDLYCAGLTSLPPPEKRRVLVTGATGYVGGRLVPELLARGYRVRAMVRAACPEYAGRWPGAEIVVADALEPDGLVRALADVHTAFYLIHSLHLGPKAFEEKDLQAAANFRAAADGSGVERIIYIGALGDVAGDLSPHLRSRAMVAEELAKGCAATTALRAALIIGSGSASYEIIRHLSERVPVMPLPWWAETRCQPISMRDTIRYLVGVLEVPESTGRTFDIGGADVLTYGSMLRICAEVLGRRLRSFRSPVSSIPLVAYVVSLLTPVPAPITMSLLRGAANEVVCREHEIRRLVPFDPLTYREAVERAVRVEKADTVRTRWADSYRPAHAEAGTLTDLAEPPRYVALRSILTTKSACSLFASVTRIGGREGWFNTNWLWRIRGAFDRAFFGVGLSRGRRSASSLRTGDAIDFWRVEELVPDRRLLLRSEMKMPGQAWLDFRIDPEGNRNRLSVQAWYEPGGVLGHVYWYVFLPFHHFIFQNLVGEISRRS
ncbi:MAG TPA: SDR family oxidoreductase [bacterium]|nr:SDR family oxidoreductase [bacterium]